MGVGKEGGAAFLKSPCGILKIIEFICCFGAIIAAMINSTSWYGDTVKLFNITAIFGAAYAFIFLICALCGAIDPKAKWNTIINICLCILLFVSASIYAVSFNHHGKEPEAYQGATSLSMGAFIAFTYCYPNWNRYTYVAFKVVSIVGFIYPFIIFLCHIFSLMDYSKFDTMICAIFSIVSIAAAACLILYYEADHSITYLAIHINTYDLSLVTAVIMEFLSGFSYFMDANFGITFY